MNLFVFPYEYDTPRGVAIFFSDHIQLFKQRQISQVESQENVFLLRQLENFDFCRAQNSILIADFHLMNFVLKSCSEFLENIL